MEIISRAFLEDKAKAINHRVNKMKSFINMLPHAKEFEYEVL